MRKPFYYFGPFRLETATRTLLCDGAVVKLTEKEFDLLFLLVSNGNKILSKEYLNESLWPDRFVEDSNLAQHVKALRKKLGEHHRGGQYIGNAYGRGYYLEATVTDSRQSVEWPELPAKVE